MSNATVAQEDQLLVSVLRENEFDVVGLAEFCPETETVDRCLRTVYRVVNRQLNPKELDEFQLAHVLIGMIAVAQQDYASGGHTEYWSFLARRVRNATFAETARFDSVGFLDAAAQRRLGEVFRYALARFSYGEPDEGSENIGPVIFHAGVTNSSLKSVMRLIDHAFGVFGPAVVSLDSETRGSFVQTFTPRVQKNVERLFTSTLLGGEQLWSCLAQVVCAWHKTGQCDAELELLPLTLDPEIVRDSLPTKTASVRSARSERPKICYDAESGEVRLVVPHGRSSDWQVRTENGPIQLYWTDSFMGSTAEFPGPLPQRVIAEPVNRSLCNLLNVRTTSGDCQVFWFHSHNGNLESGDVIKANGLIPGRWFVLVDGKPSDWSVLPNRRVRLQWAWLEGSSQWTAWEIDVPARSAVTAHIEWTVNGQRVSVPLARRPSAMFEFSKSLCTASTGDLQTLEVFGTSPAIRSMNSKLTEVLLIRESCDGNVIVDSFELQPGESLQLKSLAPGVYQLRQRRGIGKLLLRFALIPSLEVEGPVIEVSPDLGVEAGCICLRVADGVGEFLDAANNTLETANEWLMYEFSTVAPRVQLNWHWVDSDIPVVKFQWLVEGVRWRILGISDDLAVWTRDPILLSPRRILSKDAVLEIQFPHDLNLLVNGLEVTDHVQESASGKICQRSLLTLKTSESVTLTISGNPYPAVLLTDRPMLEKLSVVQCEDSLLVEWVSATGLDGCSLAVWDPADLLTPPTISPLTQAQLNDGCLQISPAVFPSRRYVAVSIVRVTGGLFRKLHQFAVRANEQSRPVAVLIDTAQGTSFTSGSLPENWQQFLFEMRLGLFLGEILPESQILQVLSSLQQSSTFSPVEAFRLCARLEHEVATGRLKSDLEKLWVSQYAGALASVLCTLTPAEGLELVRDDNGECITKLLELGIPICQLVSAAELQPEAVGFDHSVYPLAYLRALELVSTQPNGQKEAASTLLRFHLEHELPEIAAFLPMLRGNGVLQRSSCMHKHHFVFPPLRHTEEPDRDIAEWLGVADGSFECDAADSDVNFSRRVVRGKEELQKGKIERSPAPKQYSLFWSPKDPKWLIDVRRSKCEACCSSNFEPVMMKAWETGELVEHLQLHDLLNAWCSRASEKSLAGFDFVESLAERLKRDSVFGELHQLILAPARRERRQLFRMANVEIVAGQTIRREAAICWQIAWLERLSAFSGDRRGFLDSRESVELQKLLARAMQQWPVLIRRCIALAEVLIWTLGRGGIGLAAKFNNIGIPRYREDAARAIAEPVIEAGTRLTGLCGIVVQYANGVGKLLFPRKGFELKSALIQFSAGVQTTKYWLAKFSYSSLDDLDRNAIDFEYDRLKCKRGSTVRALSDVLCGYTFEFTAEYSEDWQAKDLKWKADIKRYPLPQNRRSLFSE